MILPRRTDLRGAPAARRVVAKAECSRVARLMTSIAFLDRDVVKECELIPASSRADTDVRLECVPSITDSL
jgi:hypothetical protein